MKEIVLDVETGGFDPKSDALVSVSAAVVPELGQPLQEIITVYLRPTPGAAVGEGSIAINGYNPDLWEERGAVNLLPGMSMLHDWMLMATEGEGATVIAHNAQFDAKFIEHYQLVAGIQLPILRWWCSCDNFRTFCRRNRIRARNAKLDTLGALCGCWEEGKRPSVHEADDDVKATVAGVLWMRATEAGKPFDLGALFPPEPEISEETVTDLDGSREADQTIDGWVSADTLVEAPFLAAVETEQGWDVFYVAAVEADGSLSDSAGDDLGWNALDVSFYQKVSTANLPLSAKSDP